VTYVSFSVVMSLGTRTRFAARPGRDDDELIVAGRVRLRDRVTVRLRSGRLDVALAAGVPAESTAALALRARRLISLPARRSNAATYRRLISETRDAARSGSRIAPCRERVAAASHTLSRLADALAQHGPVAPRGAAEAALLLTDGTGPLFNPLSEVSLQARAETALADLALA
jgi:hypothetical protein